MSVHLTGLGSFGPSTVNADNSKFGTVQGARVSTHIDIYVAIAGTFSKATMRSTLPMLLALEISMISLVSVNVLRNSEIG